MSRKHVSKQLIILLAVTDIYGHCHLKKKRLYDSPLLLTDSHRLEAVLTNQLPGLAKAE